MDDTDFFSTETITVPIGFRLFAIAQFDLNNILLRIRKQVITYLFDPSPIIIHSTVFTHNYTFSEIYSTFWNKYSVNITIIISRDSSIVSIVNNRKNIRLSGTWALHRPTDSLPHDSDSCKLIFFIL